MKKLNIFIVKTLFLSMTGLFFFTSCEEDFLVENPKSFLSPENTFTTLAGFESALADLHRVTTTFVGSNSLPGMDWQEYDKSLMTLYGCGTDLGWYWNKTDYYGDYSIINPFDATAKHLWVRGYTLIKGANIILTRSESDIAEWDSDDDKLAVQAEAKFFRALGYRFMVHLFGGVPIVREEITAPKLDFVRNTKEEVLDLIIEDLEFATLHLPVTNPKNGKIVKAAADHLLAEIYITRGDFSSAVTAATRVIDDPQYDLVTERFGTMTDKPGDPFWDLFRLGNQNHTDNTEVIWAIQAEYNVPGGDNNYRIERGWGPAIGNLKDPDGLSAILRDEISGRPIAFIRISPYLEYEIWQSDWSNDMRNSEYNMQREFIINNPESAYYGTVFVPQPTDTVRNHFAWIRKASHPYGHPQGYDSQGHLYSDFYMMRLAETYLLRAEAYLGLNNLPEAAADINVVRSRANATPVAAVDVNINYILDERARELVVEEPRRLTLNRLGLLDERVTAYNEVSAPSIQSYHNLLPIPQNEIDANLGAVLEQNEGYH